MGLVKSAQQEYGEAVDYHQRAIALNGDDMMTYVSPGTLPWRKKACSGRRRMRITALAHIQRKYPAGTTKSRLPNSWKRVRAAITNIENKSITRGNL
jgi:hypothetical protein